MRTTKRTKSFQYGSHQVTIETGQIARQASGSVIIRMDETVLLVTAVCVKTAVEGRDFFPLTVNYQEKYYAAGRVPGNYFRREGRPSEQETLISRLIDRPIRPLFPEGFQNEIQIVATVLSYDPNAQTDIPAILGASAALALSGVPFQGPLGAARVGFRDGSYLLNPSSKEIETSELDLVVAGTRDAVLMVESEAKELSEPVMLGAVLFGHEQMQVAIRAIEELVEESGVQGWGWQAPPKNEPLIASVASKAESQVREAYRIKDKMVRQEKIKAIKADVVEQMCNADNADAPSAAEVSDIIHDLEKNVVRSQILGGEPRIDGRDTETVRPISIEVGMLPRTHGSALFTRGETQAIVVTTLGTDRDAFKTDNLEGVYSEDFMLHYNFPPYSVGECGMIGSPKRREVGHGKLAYRALMAVIPDKAAFPYVLRIVSDITESNGSSSMATVCGSSLAMMDAGVPLKKPVAGIAMGLIKEGNQFAVLTDILGDEDHLGDMDFKVAGTDSGVTALQMDIKIAGITKEIMERALDQAKRGRLHILKIMNEAIDKPRDSISLHAPSIITIKINPEKIRDVIGKGGAVIRELCESTNTTIDITDDGVVKIAAVSTLDGEEARRRIELLTAEVDVGATYDGVVVKLMDFGAFVEILPGKQGLVHVSQIREGERIENVADVLREGQAVRVKVLEIDRQGRVRLSMKEVEQAAA